MRRLKWAMHRNDDTSIEWLEARLDGIEAEIDADLAPCREPSRFDICRQR
ncbi:hypothetical protein [Halomonas alkalisoli]|nr:hypothetical protein [Halomonas alkalisoli]MCE9681965.1 hypothetical protein [Halomonas alkalisoli]